MIIQCSMQVLRRSFNLKNKFLAGLSSAPNNKGTGTGINYSSSTTKNKSLYHFVCIRKLSRKMSKSAMVILAPGAEEMEFVISVDVLRRAGISVTIAGLDGSGSVKCSRDVLINPDKSFESAASENFDVIVLPGGLGGSKAMASSKAVGELLKKQESDGKMIAAICAAPIALASHDICVGKKLTSYPSVKDQLTSKYSYVDDQIVVHDGNLITSRGPGTAFSFALKIAEILVGQQKSDEVAKAMLLK